MASSSSSLDRCRREESKAGPAGMKKLSSRFTYRLAGGQMGGWLHGEGLISEQLTDWRVVGVHEKGRPSVWLKLTYSKQKSPGFTWESLALRTLWHGPLRTCVYSSNTLTYRPSFSSFPLPASPLCVYHALHLPAVSAMPDWGCVYYHVHGPAHNQPHRISWSIWLGRTCVDVLLWLGAEGQACLSINQAWPLNARPVSESLTTSRRAINREISFSLYITNGETENSDFDSKFSVKSSVSTREYFMPVSSSFTFDL